MYMCVCFRSSYLTPKLIKSRKTDIMDHIYLPWMLPFFQKVTTSPWKLETFSTTLHAPPLELDLSCCSFPKTQHVNPKSITST